MSLQLNPVLFPHISVFVTHTENKGRKGGKRFYSIHFCVHFIIKTSILGPGCSHWLKRWLYRWHVLFIVDNISWYDIQIHLWDMRHKFKRSMCASNRVVRKLWEAISGGSGNKVPFISAIDKLCDSLLERLDQRETLLVESAGQMINIRSDLVSTARDVNIKRSRWEWTPIPKVHFGKKHPITERRLELVGAIICRERFRFNRSCPFQHRTFESSS